MTPLVAIRCLVYNHEPFLRQCLDGFVMQQTNFPFVAVVHDDASTDNSAAIIKEYAAKYPNIFRPIYETENQYSKPGAISYIMYENSKDAKYMAYCEGDDYWTDPHKLQRQVDFLEAHPDYSAIGENGMILNTITNQTYIFNTHPSQDVSMEDVIRYRRFPTAGVVCRMDAIKGINEVCKYTPDTVQWCWLISKGKFRYSDTVSSVYRRGEQGVTEYSDPFWFGKRIEKWYLEIIRCFPSVDESFVLLWIAKIYKSMLQRSWRNHNFTSLVKCLFRGGYWTLIAYMHKIKQCFSHKR